MTESGDYISREAALDAISEWLMKALHPENMSSYNEGERAAYRTVISEIADLPAADVRPVRRREWLPIIEGNEYGETYQSGCYCSECGEVLQHEPNFCPNCGADMRPEEE